MRLQDKVAVVVGAGQKPGQTVGNGRATALTFAREGARVVAVDVDLALAEETVAEIGRGGGEAMALRADITREADIEAMVAAVMEKHGRIDVLHNNVGASLAAGDGPMLAITEENFDRVMVLNLRSMVITCKHVVPIMRQQEAGAIVNISSLAAWEVYPNIGYKTAKAGVIAFTRQLAAENARYGVRANVILPGLMETPMAVDTRVEVTGRSREEIVAERNARVPLKGGMGSGWDVANAALFLACDEGRFITGAALPVDGGGSLGMGGHG
jgi:NAD(P)-dependent dehydrogenase (short-subunit alcohol dehydrogenase family)